MTPYYEHAGITIYHDMDLPNLFEPRLVPGDAVKAPEGTTYRVLWVRGQNVRVVAAGRHARGRAVPAVTITLDEATRRRV